MEFKEQIIQPVQSNTNNNNNNNISGKMEFHPSKEMKKLQRKLFDTHSPTRISIWRPAVDIKENESSIVIVFELPGLSKDNVSIDVSKDASTIIISGEKKYHKKDDTEKCHRIESSYGKFIRSYRLPPGTDPAKIKATMNDGVLEINIAKEKLEKLKIPIVSKL
ncbi:heat shock protein Hsp20 domain-containing protein [Heterostelium album PN500]|uniref:Heat shock protein Hsp20 domain-containing protein n=1 Tax=Heterostelium pallidum (strain ATCC 26659 / Pp 5 / PN500) TaxID=670386 RepID=D3B498_HETP5|nr:heat shock protein Hsp20 domain-containing protein [Heterostelium album PN500]EFA84146.1 heat shock protein Hsp20 domain-containing protein [Heterostelium album PN500]|eukprot:XP_020436263.1 heat shock protein Hsp20 domain-containing protein [Heterostelium album PN500]